jgi:hypothetical protein
MALTVSPLDGDPQIDFIVRAMVDLAREVKKNRLSGRFSIEFSATSGDIRAPNEDRRRPLNMPKPLGGGK